MATVPTKLRIPYFKIPLRRLCDMQELNKVHIGVQKVIEEKYS